MSYKNFVENLQEKVAKHPHKPFLHQPQERQWRQITWAECYHQARCIASGLRAQNHPLGSRIGILAKNCAEWFIADVAIIMAGYVSVPVYTTANHKTLSHIIGQSDMQALFIGKLDDFREAEKAIPADLLTISFPYPTMACKQHWQQWLTDYQPLEDIHQPQLEDVMSIVYTSGCAGVHKGVCLSHKNLAAAAQATAASLNITARDRCMSYLPLAHITERSVVEGTAFSAGGEIFFVESLDTFVADVQHAQPTKFLSVPRLWLKFQSQILLKMSDKKLQRLLAIPLLGKWVAYKIRKAMGLHKTDTFGSGTAPISQAVLQWFNNIGIAITEGWGMTELAGLACTNIPPTALSRGTIGKPLASVEMKLSADKEILIRGDAVFTQYYQDEKETAQSFTDGWFKTGDCAELTAAGDYKIVGRLKEQFKTAKGKYVAPVPIESLLFANPYIEQVCVVGYGLKQPVALLVLQKECRRQDPELEQELLATLAQVNAQLESHERLDKLILCADPWSIENDLLTPTLKIKRNVLESHYQQVIATAPDEKLVWQETLPVVEQV